MSLSNDLLSQFVKVNRDTTKPKTETTVYGTTVEYEGKIYVRLDGSDLLTPVESTVATEPDERVTVMIKDHTATITGNLSSPSARKDDVDGLASQISEFEIIVADVVHTDELNAEIARINQLAVEDAMIRGELTAGTARIDELIAKDAEITGKLTANEAEIADLKTGKLDAEIAAITYATIENLNATNADIHNLSATFGDFEQLTAKNFEAVNATLDNLDAEYANIDFANIGEAAIKKIFADSGLIKDIIVGNGTITGELIGVTIKGDLIEANTLKADKLIVKGSDGLYYKLNFESGNFKSAEEVPADGLHGSVIIAKSITADRIAVTDLVAFGATIGGFMITNNAIHSVVKTSVNNTTRGFYVDNDGQFAIGDSNNFVKYYLDTDGEYKLAISAGSMVLSSRNQSVEDALDDMQKTVDGLDKIEVGGRNLLRDTKAFGGEFTIDKTEISDEIYDGFTVRHCVGENTYDWILQYTDAFAIEKYGEQFILSFWAKGTGHIMVDIQAKSGYADIEFGSNGATYKILTLTEDWQRYVLPLKATSSGTLPSTLRSFGFLTYNTSSAYDIYLCGCKLERGNTATDWTPAPEDAADVEVDVDAIVNGIEIGGRNLLPLTRAFDDKVFTQNDANPYVWSSKVIDETYNGCSVRYCESTISGAYFASWDNVMTTNYGDTYTLSFWAKGSGSFIVAILNTDGPKVAKVVTSQGVIAETANVNNRATFTLSENWTRYWATYTFANAGDITAPRGIIIYQLAGMRMCGVKFEKGNKATDWAPAPEDGENAIADAQNTASNAQASATDAQGRVEVAEATLQILADSISSLVTDENGTSLMTQTADGWTFNLSTVTETIGSATETLNDLSGKVDGVDETINNLNSLVDDLGKKTAYITMTTDSNGDPCIELGKSDNDFKVRITNTSVDFLEGSSRIAYVSNRSLYIEKAIIKDELQIGEGTGFIWKRRSNGNLGLRWIGG